MDTLLERDIHQERRRLFWQRIYAESLEHVIKLAPLDASGTGRLAAEHAAEAVRRFDAWEEQTETGDDPDRGQAGQDEPASPYLGGGG